MPQNATLGSHFCGEKVPSNLLSMIRVLNPLASAQSETKRVFSDPRSASVDTMGVLVEQRALENRVRPVVRHRQQD